MTLAERAALIDQRARDSYSHGTYCAQVPAIALQMLQEAVAETVAREQEHYAQLADRLAEDPWCVAIDVANAIRREDRTGVT